MEFLNIFLKKVMTFIRLSFSEKILLLKILMLSIIVEITLRFLSFNHIANWLNIHQKKIKNPQTPEVNNLQKIKNIFRIILKNIPLFKCYNQALSARIILRSYGYPSSLFIGFRRDNKNQLKGHAWLKCCNKIITGEFGHKTYTVTAVFED